MKRLTFLFFFSHFFILGLFAEDITISSAEELIAFQKSVNDLEEGFDYSGSTIYLANDINLEDIDWIPIGTEGRPFRGTFDGKGHWIHNLTVKVEGGLHAGLFGYIGAGGKVQRVGISSGVVRIRKKANPDFVEVKAYMCVGSSRERLTLDNMPTFDEVKDFASKIGDACGKELVNESEISRVVLLE